ncbi:hypothetical protein Poli38472_006748 [Pythium oligandrum]|uniref:CBF1-interacting co-repressor CIR N-terminal domain-containing protein n=1 Tax=Pythium oligandrum TaxID=41045 RepID=A0A8K1C5M5_PYTOL|nr:hypothetical protein Poli38472_006748 [Pythium oligandrum]|eukprot:TMW56738.1 hypothetical protein Poli38472_006748 [Pythium oligandrum]
MAGIKFLNLKGWHPSNARNQKRIWIAEQTAKAREQQEQEAAAEVRKNAEIQRFQELAAARGDVESARRVAQQQVGFMYAPPPGLQKVEETTVQDEAEDDAVREFRRKMEKKTGSTQEDPRDTQRTLERYVGRRPDEPLTIKEQVERFPFLKDAPVEGNYTSSVKVNFKPMGRQLRNVRCLRCGQWGHQSGDRECAMRDQNPLDAARQAREDPMTFMAQLKKQELVLRKAALPLEMQGEAGKAQEYDIILSEEEDADPEKAFLAKLSSREKRSLLKKLRKQSKDDHSSSSSSSDSESSSSSDDEDSSRRKRRRKSKDKRRVKKSKSKRVRKHQKSDRDVSDEKKRSHRGREGSDQDRRRNKRVRSRSRSRSRGDERKRRHRSSDRRRDPSSDEHYHQD